MDNKLASKHLEGGLHGKQVQYTLYNIDKKRAYTPYVGQSRGGSVRGSSFRMSCC